MYLLQDMVQRGSRMEDLVSVIVPIYNVEKWLVRCLDSVRAQTYRHMEIILVDDGSEDQSAVLCDCFEKIDGRIRVLHKKNGGLSSARNAGLDAASGKYIYFLDGDDYIEPQLLEKSVAMLEYTGDDWCSFWAVKEDAQGSRMYQIAFRPERWELHNEEDRFFFLLEKFLNYYVGWEACFHLYRREIIDRYGLRFASEREVYAEDLLFSFEYLLHARSGSCVPEPFYHYVERSDSLTGCKKDENILPQIHELACRAYDSAEKAGASIVQERFIFLYMALMEWHSRKYIAAHGLLWVKEKLNQIGCAGFFPEEKETTEALYLEHVERYGSAEGIISVVVPAFSDAEAAKSCVSGILEQSIQRLDIMVMSTEENLDLPRDWRVRKIQADGSDPDEILRLGFEKGFGEYLYFADTERTLSVTFLERLSDAMKYNGCSTGIMKSGDSQPAFYSCLDAGSRRKIRQILRDAGACVMFRKDLLHKGGFAHMRPLGEYIEDIILTGDVICLGEGI